MPNHPNFKPPVLSDVHAAAHSERWFLAGKGDIGGFGVGSDLAWCVQGTVGYQFTKLFSMELGYRYFDTDYRDGDFKYDLAEHGLFLGFNFTF